MIVRYPASRLLIRVTTDDFGGIEWTMWVNEKYDEN